MEERVSRRATWVAAAVLAGATALAGMAGDAAAQDRKHRWKMASVFPSGLAHFGPVGTRFAEQVTAITGGTVNIRFYEPGALVPPAQTFDAVAKGGVDAAYHSAGFTVGKFPQAAVFSTVPFGPSAGAYLAWYRQGGGREMHQALYAAHNVQVMNCWMLSPEAGGWFRKEIRSVDDLKGLKMRIAGYAGNVVQRFGVSAQMMAGGDIYPALERGTLDATEFSMPVVDLGAGFHQIAKHYYLPGWHQQATFHELLVNMDKWKALSDTQRVQIEAACDASLLHSYADAEATNFKALAEIKKKGVQVHTFSPEILTALRKAWEETAAELSAQSPEFKKAYESLNAFRKDYDSWANAAYLR